MTTCRDWNRCALPFFLAHTLYFIRGRRKSWYNLQYHSTPGQSWDCSLIKRHKNQVGTFQESDYLSVGNPFVTQLLLDGDLINLCCFLCLTMTLFLRKQIILSNFCTCPLRHLFQIIWNNWIILMHLHLWKYIFPSVLLMFTLWKWGGSYKEGARL